nr:MAG TPA: hypothetical protein [Caudoviricetes sp.]
MYSSMNCQSGFVQSAARGSIILKALNLLPFIEYPCPKRSLCFVIHIETNSKWYLFKSLLGINAET